MGSGERGSGGVLGGGDLEDFLRDAGLAGLVVFEGEVAEELGGVVLRGLHRDHPGAVLGGLGIERVLEILRAELRLIMQQMGTPDIASIVPSMVVKNG